MVMQQQVAGYVIENTISQRVACSRVTLPVCFEHLHLHHLLSWQLQQRRGPTLHQILAKPQTSSS